MNNPIRALLRQTRSALSAFNEPDVYVVSYPKSGRTWLRALIGKYLSLKYELPEEIMLSTETITSKSGLPTVSFTHDGSALMEHANHEELSHDRRKYRQKKVMLIGRDIKDTLVSAYFQATKRINVFEGTISEFIATEEFGVRKIVAFYDAWLKNRHVPGSFLFIRYEDLHQDPCKALENVLCFMGEVNVDEELLRQSVEFCSFKNLKKLESQDKFKNGFIKARDPADSESYKVRKGKVGGYTEYLSKEDQAFIDAVIEECSFEFAGFNEGTRAA